MDIYQQCLHLVSSNSEMAQWPELLELYTRYVDKKIFDWRLPIFVGEALGHDPSTLIPAVAAVSCMHRSILLVDDILDDDPRGDYHELGVGVTANMGLALQGIGAQILEDSELAPDVKLAALAMYRKGAVGTARGQHYDVMGVNNEQEYWANIVRKSGPMLAASMCLGAILTRNDPTITAEIYALGNIYAEIQQVHDDLGDALRDPPNSDWSLGRKTLPILYALEVDHPERARFTELFEQIRDRPLEESFEKIAEARQIIVRSGGMSYSLHRIIEFYKQAKARIDTLDLPNPDKLTFLFSYMLEPVEDFLRDMGGDEETISEMMAV